MNKFLSTEIEPNFKSYLWIYLLLRIFSITLRNEKKMSNEVNLSYLVLINYKTCCSREVYGTLS